MDLKFVIWKLNLLGEQFPFFRYRSLCKWESIKITA